MKTEQALSRNREKRHVTLATEVREGLIIHKKIHNVSNLEAFFFCCLFFSTHSCLADKEILLLRQFYFLLSFAKVFVRYVAMVNLWWWMHLVVVTKSSAQASFVHTLPSHPHVSLP